MSAHADIAAAMGDVLDILATPSLTYRTGTSGAFSAISGSMVLHVQRAEPISYMEDEEAETVPMSAILKAATSATALAIGYQIQDGDSQTWAVVGKTHQLPVVIYQLRRMTLADGDQAAGVNRKGGG